MADRNELVYSEKAKKEAKKKSKEKFKKSTHEAGGVDGGRQKRVGGPRADVVRERVKNCPQVHAVQFYGRKKRFFPNSFFLARSSSLCVAQSPPPPIKKTEKTIKGGGGIT